MPSAKSGTLTWYADPFGVAPGGSGTWDLVGTNWLESDLGGIPTTWLDDGSGDARFEGDPGDVTLGSNLNASSLTFAVDGYRILGGAGPFGLTLGAGGVTADGNAEIASGLTLGASQTWSVLTAKNLTVSGAIGGTGGLAKQGAGTLTLSSANTFSGATTLGGGTLVLGNSAALAGSTLDLAGGTGTLSFASTGSYQLGGLSGSRALDLGANTLVVGGNNAATTYSGILSGTGGLTKAGTGTLTLSGANTFTGKVAVTGGTLSVAAESALGAAPATATADAVTLNGGTLAVTVGNQSFSANRGITLGASGGTLDTSSIADTTSLGVTFAGAITGTGNLTLRAHGDLSATGGGSNTHVTLTGANTFVGTVTITDGLVNAASGFGDAANALRFDNGGGLLQTGTTGSLARSVEVLSGGGTVRVYGSSTLTHTGALLGSGRLARTDNGTFVLAGDVSGFTGTLANLAGTTVLDTTVPGAFAGVTLTGGSLLVRNNHAALGAALVTVDGSATFGTQAGSATVLTSNAFSVSGTNTLTIAGSNAPLVLTGALAAGTGNLYLNAGNITLAGAGATGSILTVAGTGGTFIAPGFSGTFSAARLTSINTGGNAITMMTGGTLQVTGVAQDNRDAYFHFAQIGGTTRFAQLNSNQTESGSNGGGFAGLSSYDLLGGVLEVGHMYAGSGGGSFNRSHYVMLGGGTLRGTVDNAAWQGYLHALPGTVSALDSNGFTLVPIRNISGTGTIRLTGVTGKFQLNNIASATASFSGSGAMEKTGTGTTALSGDFSDYTGTLTLSAGTTQLGADVNRGFAGVITGSGALQKVGTGVLTLTGANTWSGNLAINAGAVSIDSVASLPGWDSNGRFSVAAGAALAVGNSITVAEIAALRATTNFAAGSYLGFDTSAGDRTYSANLTGAVGVAKFGANTLTLTGGTTFTGNLLVQAGTLDLGGASRTLAGQVAFGGGLTRNGSIVSTTSAYDGRAGSVSANLGGSGGLTKTTNGVLSLSGTNTYTGITTVNAGVLAVADKSSLPGWNLNRSWFVASGGSLTVGNAFSDADVELMLGLANFGANASFGFDTSAGDRVYAGAIGNSTSGARGLAKSGANTLTVSGISTFTGPVVVAGGTLAFGYLADGGPSNLGAYSSFSLANGGILRFTGTLGSTVRSLAVGTGGGVIQVDAGGSLVFGPGGSGVTGAWTGSGGVTKTGAGTLTVGNNYAGATNRFNVGSDSGGNFTMAEGVLNISPTQFFTLGDNSQDATFLQTGGTVNYTAPNGSYIGNGTGGPYSASLVITGGTFNQPLDVMRVGQNGYSRGYLTIGGGAGAAVANVNQVQLGASSGQSTGIVTLLAGGTLATSSLTRGGGAGFVIFDGGTLRATASASNFLGGISTTIRNGGAFVDDGGFTVTVGQSIIGAEGSTGGLTKRGAGVLRLGSLNTYAGNTAVEAGTLAVASSASLPGWDTPGRLSVAAGAGLAVGNNFTDAQVGQLLAAGGFSAGAFFGFDTFNGDRAYAGVLADTSAGSLGLVKVGANTLTLSGTNTFTGAAAVREGILISSRAAALATASSLTVANGATLAVAVGGAAGYTDSQLGDLLGRSTFSDGSTLGFDTSAATAPSAYSSALSGGLGFTKIGAGQLTLSGALTYGGPTNVLGGSLVLSGVAINNTSALNLGGGALDLGGGASRVGAVSLTSAAASGVTLANGTLAATSFAFSNASGNAQVSAGLSTYTGGIAKTGAGTVTLVGGSGVVGGTLSVNGGTFAVDGATLSVGSVTLGGGAVLTLGAGSLRTTVSQASLNTGTLNITGGDHSFIGFRSSDSSGANTVINHTGGTLTVTGAVINNGTDNSFMLNHWGNGAVSTYNLSGGTLNVLNTKALLGWDGTAVFNISGGVANLRGLNFNSARGNSSTVNLTGGRINLGVSGIEGNNTNETLNAGAGTIGAYADWSTTKTIVLTDAATGVTFDSTDSVRGLARTLTLSGVLSGTGALRATGSGVTVLNAANTYTGLTTVLNGALRLSNATALAGGIGATGGTGALALNGGVIDLAAGDFSRALGTGAGQVAFVGSGGFAATGAARTVNLGGAGAQVIWGAGSFVPDGGQLILGHALSNATVTFANAIDLGAAARTVRADEGSAAIDGILSGPITGTGSLVKTGAGTLRLTGTNTYSGGTVVSAGTLSVASSASLPGWNQAGGFSIASGAALAVDNTFLDADLATLLATGNFASGSLLGFDTTAGNREVTAALTSPVGLVKTGANTLTLSGANNFTGDTLVSGGTLLFSGGSDRLSTTGAISVTGGTLDLGGNSQTTSGPVALSGGTLANGNLVANGAITLVSGTLSANVSGSGGLTKSGLGTGVLSGTNTFTGGISVTGGTLQFSGASAGGDNTLTVNGGDLAFLFDGTTGAGLEDVAFGNDLDVRANAVLTLGRLGTGSAGLNLTALNKTAVLGDLTLGASTLEVIVNQGYGVAFGAANLTGAAEIRVTGATDSNVVPGATLRGVVSGSAGLTKSGNGTLVLGNAGNTFSGHLTVNAGYVAAGSDGALGDAANELRFAPGAGLRALDSFSLGRTLRFSAGASSINLQVVSGETLEFTGSLADATNQTQLIKSDRGSLRLSAAGSSSWSGSLNTLYDPTALTGGLLINAGVVEITHAQALGAPSNVVALNASTGAALHLSGGITLANTVAYLPNANYANGMYSGVRGIAALSSLDGANTLSGLLTFRQDFGVGAAAGATLNLTGGVQAAGHILSVVGPGTVNISGGALTVPHSIYHLGSGTLNLNSAIGAYTGNGTRLFGGGGTMRLAGDGVIASNNKAHYVYSGDTLWVDNSGSNFANRLGGAGELLLTDGNFRLTASSTGSTWENFAALNTYWGSNLVQVDTTAQSSILRFTNITSNAIAGGSNLIFRAGGTGAAFGTAANTVLFTTTAPNLTNGILAGVVVVDSQGVNLATHLGGSLRAFTGYTDGSNLGVSSAYLANANVKASSSVGFAGGSAVNALVLDGGVTLSRSVGNPTLALSTGNLLVASGTATIGSGLIIQGTSGTWDTQIAVAEGATLDVNGTIVNSYNTTIAQGGTVNFNTRQYFNTKDNWLTLGRGRVELNAGDNTLYEGTSFAHGQQNLAMGYGSVLDLNGSVQLVGALRNPNNNGYENSGGEVTSATAALLVSRTVLTNGENFGGRITGAITYIQNSSNTNARNFYSDNTYTGKTVISGGTFQLYDGGRISGTSAIEVNSAYLNIRNDSMYDLADRVVDTAPITLRGGFIYLQGRPQGDSRETLGAVTLSSGISDFRVDTGGTNVNSTVLTLASLASANDAAVNFRGWGLVGNAARLIIADRETNAGLTNNLIGAWAVVNGGDFASYVPGLGVGALNQTGFAGYDGTVLPGASAPNANIKLAAAATQAAGDLALNSLVLGGNYSFTNAADTLRLTSGGLLRSGGAVTFGGAADSGRLTAGAAGASGTQSLHIHANSSAVTMNSRIVDNGAAPVRLVLDVYNGGGLTLLSGNNSYTGGTVVNGWTASAGTLTVGATGRLPGGGITLNNANLSLTSGGAIDTSNVVTLNNRSTLTLTGNNTLAGLVFNHLGGTNSAVNTGGTLTLTGGITATNPNTAAVGIISGALTWNGAAATVTVNPMAYDGRTITDRGFSLLIDAVISNTGLLTIQGGGNLALRGANTFAGGVLVKSGTGVGLNNAASFGTGSVTFEDNARLLAYSSGLTATNAWTALGGVDFDGINNFTLGGAATLRPNGTTDINVVMPQGLLVLTGALGGTNSTLEKTGLGVLRLGNAANTLAAVKLTEGTLQLNNAAALGSAALELAGGNLDSATANLALTTTGAQTWSGDFGFVGSQNLNLGAGAVTLTANRSVGVSANVLTVGGVVADGGAGYSLTKLGAGTLALGGANTYGGSTVVGGGALRLTSADALPAAGNLTLAGGVLDLAAGDFSRSLGSGAGQVSFGAPGGGFAATGAARTVNLGGAGAQVAWGSGSFLADGSELILSHSLSDNTVTLANPVALGSSNRTVRVDNGSAAVDAVLGGALSGTGGLVKAGAGTLRLDGANTYTGTTFLAGGTLVSGVAEVSGVSGAFGNGGALTFTGGALQISAFLTGDLAARIQNSTGAIAIDTNGLGYNLTGNLASSNTGGLTKLGAGTLRLTGTNAYTGATTVTGGTLVVGSDANLGVSSSSPLVLNSGTLLIAGADRFVTGRPLGLTANSTLNVNNVNGAVFGVTNGAGYQLTKDGLGDLALGTGTAASTLRYLLINGGNISLGDGTLTLNAGGVQSLYSSASATVSGGSLVLGGNSDDMGTNSGTVLTINSKVTGGSAFELWSSGGATGVTVLANAANDFTGSVALNVGIVSVASINNAGTASHLGAGSGTNNMIDIQGNSVLRYTGAGSTTNRYVRLTGTTAGAVIDHRGTGLLKFTTDFSASGAGTKTLTLTGWGTGSGEINANVADNSASNRTNILKEGTNTWILSRSSSMTYTGSTEVRAGTLELNFANLGTPTNLVSASSALTLGGGTLYLRGKSGTTGNLQTFAGLTLNGTAGSRLLANPNGNTAATGVSVTLGAITATTAGSSLLLGKDPGTTGTVTFTTTTAKPATNIYSPRIVYSSGTGYDWMTTVSGASPFTLSGLATASYTNLILTGTDTANARLTASANLTGSVTTNTLKVDGPAAGQSLGLGANTLTLTGGGLLATGTNAFSVTGGTLTAGNGNGAYELLVHQYSTGTLTIGSVIANNSTNAVALTKAGTGTLDLTGANTYGGATYLHGGTLVISGSIASTSVTLAGGTLRAGSAGALATGATVSVNVGTLDLNGFNRTLANLGAGTLGGLITDNAAGAGTTTLTLTGYTPALLTRVADGATRKVALVVANTNNGNNFLNSDNTFSGGLTLAHGSGDGTRLSISNSPVNSGVAGAIVSSPFGRGTITIGQAATDKAQIFVNTVNGQTILNDIVYNTARGTDRVGAFRLDLNNFVLAGTQTSGLAPVNFSSNSATSSAFITGKVTGALGLQLVNNTFVPAGVLTLTLANAAGTNDYAGDTLIEGAHALVLGASNQLPDGTGKGNLVFTGTGTFDLNGLRETVNGLSGAGTIDGSVNSGGAAYLGVGSADASSTFAGAIRNTTGTLTLDKLGSGTLTLTGAATHTGGTVVTGGVLSIGSGGTAGSLAGNTSVASGAALVFNRSDAVAYAGSVSGEGQLRQVGAGTLTLSGASTHTGGTLVSNGTLAVAADSALGAVAAVPTANQLILDNGTLSATGTFTLAANRGVGLGGESSAGSGTVSVDAGRTLTLAGVLSDRGTGAGSLIKSGAGTLVLAGANTHTGSITVQGGRLEVSLDSNLGAAPVAPAARRLVLAGGTLAATNGFVLDANRGLALTGTGTVEVAANQTLSYGGIVADGAGAGSLVKTGAGTLLLSGANTFTGTTTIGAGTLAIGGQAVFGPSLVTVASGATLAGDGMVSSASVASGGRLSAGIAGVGTLTFDTQITFQGSSTLALGVAGGAVSSSVVVAGGLDILGGDGSLTFDFGNRVAEIGAGTYNLLSYGGLDPLNLALFSVSQANKGARQTLTLVDGVGVAQPFAVALQVQNARAVWSGLQGASWTAADNWTLDTDGSVTSFLAADAVVFDDTGATGSVNLLQDVNPASIVFSGSTLAYEVGSTGGFRITSGALGKTGAATLTLLSANTFAGGSNLAAGSVRLGDDAALGTGRIDLGAARLSSVGAAPRTLANALLLAGNPTLGSATDNGLLTLAGTVDLGGATRSLAVDSDVVISGAVGNGGLTKTGAAALTLAGTNTFGGGLTLQSGTLRVGSAGALGFGQLTLAGGRLSSDSSSARAIANTVAITGDLVLGDATRSGVLTLSGAIGLGGGARRLDFASDVIVSGALADGGLTKAGAGTLTLTGANTYAGGTVVEAGILRIGAGGLTGSLVGDIDNESAVIFNRSDRLEMAGVLSGSGDYSHLGAGTLALSGLNTQTGTFTVAGGVLEVAADANLGAGELILDGGTLSVTAGFALDPAHVLTLGPAAGAGSGTLRVAAGQTFSYAGEIGERGVATLFKQGAGTLVLAGDSAHTGGTVISAGTLRLGDGGASGSVLGNIANSGTLVFNRSDTLSFAGVISGSGSLVQAGSGTLSLAAENTFTGSTTVSAGTLLVSADNQLGEAPGSATAGSITLSGGVLAANTSFQLSSSRGLAVAASGGFLSVGDGATLTYGGTVGNIAGQAGVLVKQGAGTLVLTNLTAHTGGTRVAEGTLRLAGSAFNLLGSPSAPITLSAGAVLTAANATNNAHNLGLLTLEGGTLTSVNGPGGVANDGNFGNWILRGVVVGGSAASLISSTTLQVNSGEFTVGDVAAGVDLLVSSRITGASAVTKAGLGTMELSGANAHTGTTSVNAGTLLVTNSAGLGTGALSLGGGTLHLAADTAVGSRNVTLAGTGGSIILDRATAGEALAVSFGNLTFGDTRTLAVTKGANVTSGTATLNFTGFPNFGPANRTATIDTGADVLVNITGSLTGTQAFGLLTKSGAGTLALSGNNNYWDPTNGLVTVSAGTLDLRNVNALGDGTTGANSIALSLAAGSTVRYSTDSAQGNHADVTTTGSGASLVLDRAAAGAGVAQQFDLLNLAAGTLVVRAGDNVTSGTSVANFNATTLAGNATLDIRNSAAGGAGRVNLNGAISGAGFSLAKTGDGTLLLGGANTYTGGTSVDGGTVILTGTLSNTGAVNVNTGTLLMGNNDRFGGHVSAASPAITVGPAGILQSGGYFNTLVNLSLNGGRVELTGGANATFGAFALKGSVTTGGSQASVIAEVSGANNGINLGPTDAAGTVTFAVADATGDAAADLLVEAVLRDNRNAGNTAWLANGLTKTGAGTLALAAANTFSGETRATAGVLRLLNASALGSSTLRLAAGDTGTVDFAVAGDTTYVLGGLAGERDLALGSNSLTVGGNNGSADFSGGISLGGSLTKVGTGTLGLLGANSIGGAVTVNAGLLGFASGSLDSAASLTLNGGGLRWAAGNTQDISARITFTAGTTATLDTNGNNVSLATALGGGTNVNLTKAGAGNLVLGAALAHTGALSVTGGSLEFGQGYLAGSSSISLGGGTLRWAAGNTEDISGKVSFVAGQTAGFDTNGQDITLASALGNSTSGGLRKAGAGTLTLAASATFTGNLAIDEGALRLSGSSTLAGGAYAGSIANAGQLQVATSANQTLSGAITGAGSLAKSGSGVLTLSGNSAFTGGVEVLDGTLRLSSNTGAGTGTITLGGAGSGNVALLINNNSDPANAIVVSALGSGTVTIGSDGGGAGANATFYRGNLTLNRATTLTAGSTDRTTYEGVISGSVGTLTFGGNARTTLANAGNDYIGATVVSAGAILQVDAAAGALPDGTDLTVNGSLYLNSLTRETVASLAGSGVVQVHPSVAGAHALIVAGESSTTFSGLIRNGGGTVSLAKSGSGTLTLTGANTYTDGTSVTGGTLAFAAGSLGSTGQVTVNGGTLRWEGANTSDLSGRLVLGANGATLDTGANEVAFAGALNAAGNLTKQGSGTLVLLADGALAGSATVGAGRLVLGSLNSVGGAAIDIAAGATLTLGFSLATDTTLANAITGAGLIEVATSGAGKLSLGAYNGDILLSDGDLDIAGFGGDIVYAGGAVVNGLTTFGGTFTVAAGATWAASAGLPTNVILVQGATIDFAGAAGQTLSAAIDYRGGTLANGDGFVGNLMVNGTGVNLVAGSLGNGAVILTNGNSASVGAGLANTIRYQGGTLSNLGGFAGRLEIASGATFRSDGPVGGTVAVTSGATLAGNGSYETIELASGGLIAPGNSPGVITVGTLNLSGGSGLSFQFFSEQEFVLVDGELRAGYDRLEVTTLNFGDVSAQNRINLTLATLANWADVNPGAPLPGSDLNHLPGELKSFSLITFQQTDRVLADGQNLSHLFNFDTDGYLATDGTSPASGFQVIAHDIGGGGWELTFQVIPEPSTYGLILGGLSLAAAAIRRRARRRSGTAAQN